MSGVSADSVITTSLSHHNYSIQRSKMDVCESLPCTLSEFDEIFLSLTAWQEKINKRKKGENVMRTDEEVARKRGVGEEGGVTVDTK